MQVHEVPVGTLFVWETNPEYVHVKISDEFKDEKLECCWARCIAFKADGVWHNSKRCVERWNPYAVVRPTVARYD